MMVRGFGLSYISKAVVLIVTGVILPTRNPNVPRYYLTPIFVFNVNDARIAALTMHTLSRMERILSTEAYAINVASVSRIVQTALWG